MKILGYKYLTEQEAIDARKDCSDYYGIPVDPNDVTQYWVDYEYASLDSPPFYYIKFVDSVLEVLGDPEEFEVTFPPFP
jgi:hypothetical protein